MGASFRLGFASDYDGTLRRGRVRGVSKADLDAIARFRAAGGVFGMDTGRTQRGLSGAIDGVLAPDFAVVSSGALVLGPKCEVLWERRMPRDAMAELVRKYRVSVFGLYLVSGDGSWTTSPISVVRRSRSEFNIVRTLNEIPDPIYGVAFRALTAGLAARLAERINCSMGDAVQAYQNGTSVDVVPHGCSKASGLDVVRCELGVDVLGAIGDSFNDVPMISAADVGYTFPSSPSSVREAADKVVPSVAAALTDFMGRMQ